MKQKLFWLSFVMFLISLAVFVGAPLDTSDAHNSKGSLDSERSEINVTRGSTWNEECDASGCLIGVAPGIINYDNGSEFVPINNTLVPYNQNGYDYTMQKADYTFYVKNHSSYGDAIKSCRRYQGTEYCFTYQIQDYAYYDKNGAQDYISSVIDKIGKAEGNIMRFNDTFPNVTLEYVLMPEVLKENFIINALPKQPASSMVAPITLDIGGYFSYDTNLLTMYVDGSAVTSNNYDLKTNGSIDFKTADGITMFRFPDPYAYDANHSTTLSNITQLSYRVRKQGQSRYFYIKIPFDWLNDSIRNYPIAADPVALFWPNQTGWGDGGGVSVRNDWGYGAATTINVGSTSQGAGVTRRLWAKWNLTDIPPSDSTVNDANFTFYCEANFGTPVTEIYRMTVFWREGTDAGAGNDASKNDSTWSEAYYQDNNPGGPYPDWATVGGDYYTGETIDAKSASASVFTVFKGNDSIEWIVQSWVNGTFPNYGIILKNDQEGDIDDSCIYSTDDATAARRPLLMIDYTPNQNPTLDEVFENRTVTKSNHYLNNLTINCTDPESKTVNYFTNSSDFNINYDTGDFIWIAYHHRS